MNEEKSIASPKVKIKKRKTKTFKKTKADKSPFSLDNNLKPISVAPEAEFKIKKEPLTVKPRDSKKIYGRIAFSFVALTLILVAIVLYFGLTRLNIVIIPTQEKISDSSTMEIINQAGGLSLGSEQIYGIVRQVPVEQFKEFNASGKAILGQEVIGKITIINNYVKNQPLVATTRLLSSDNKLFRLKNTVNAPAGGRVEAEIYADDPKPEAAVGPGKFTIPGLWAGIQDKIYAQSQEPMKYSQKLKYTIQQRDVDTAVKELRNDLLANAKNQVAGAYQNYAQALFAVDNNSITQEVNGKVGEEKEKFSIKMTTMVAVVAFNDEQIYNRVKAKLAANLADDKEISNFKKQDMLYILGDFNITGGTAVVKVDSTAQAALKDSAKVIKKNNLTGLSYEQLRTYLNSLPEVAGYQIKFFPSFIRKAPSLVDRIEIKIKK